MRTWLRRLAMRRLDLNSGEYVREIEKHNRRLYKRNCWLDSQIREAHERIDDLTKYLDGYRKTTWRPALELAKRDIQEANGTNG